MKKYLLGLFAVVLAVGFSAFTVTKAPKQAARYAIHNGTTTASEDVFASYSFQATAPTSLPCPGAVIVCWFQVPDVNGNGVTELSEFNSRVDALDIDNDGIISDDQAEAAGLYQEKL